MKPINYNFIKVNFIKVNLTKVDLTKVDLKLIASQHNLKYENSEKGKQIMEVAQ